MENVLLGDMLLGAVRFRTPQSAFVGFCSKNMQKNLAVVCSKILLNTRRLHKVRMNDMFPKVVDKL